MLPDAAAHLRPGGAFVVENYIPELRRLPPGESKVVFVATPTHIGVEEYDIAAEVAVSHHYWLGDGELRTFSSPHRYVWPAELDLMARLAGHDASPSLGQLGAGAVHERESESRFGLGEGVDPRMPAGEASEFWDDQAATFDDEADHGLRDPFTREAWRRLLRAVLPDPPADVADLGCGTGSLSVLLAEDGYRLTGVDLSAEMVAAATRKAADSGVSVAFDKAMPRIPTLPPRRSTPSSCAMSRGRSPRPSTRCERGRRCSGRRAAGSRRGPLGDRRGHHGS